MCGMRAVLVFLSMGLLLLDPGGLTKPARVANAVSPSASMPSTARPRVDFDTQVKPILQSKCMPCHFSGGQMYERLPFDKPETIRKLGTRLFTRIKDQNDRRTIEDFLSQ
jgi:hypothetical protein